MSDLSERLKDLIEYKGFLQKEVAAMANIKKRALDMYLGSRKSMPPADVAVKLATALDVSVEYLVTGKNPDNISKEDCLLLDKWHKLDSGTKKSVNLLIDAALAERSKDTKK